MKLSPPGKPRPLSMPVDTCLGVVDPYAKPWNQGRKGRHAPALTSRENPHDSVFVV